MSIRNCHCSCWRDRDTRELFCLESHRWVEECPKEEIDDEGEDDD